jgi:hypothetical protein
MIASCGLPTHVLDARPRAELAGAARPLRCKEGRRDPGAASRGRRAAPKQPSPENVVARSRRPQRTEPAAPDPVVRAREATAPRISIGRALGAVRAPSNPRIPQRAIRHRPGAQLSRIATPGPCAGPGRRPRAPGISLRRSSCDSAHLVGPSSPTGWPGEPDPPPKASLTPTGSARRAGA